MKKTVATVIAISIILSLSSQTFAEVQDISTNNAIVLDQSSFPDDGIIHSMDPLDQGNVSEVKPQPEISPQPEVNPVQEVKPEEIQNPPSGIDVKPKDKDIISTETPVVLEDKTESEKNKITKADKENIKAIEKKIKNLLKSKQDLQIKLKKITKEKKNKYKIDKAIIEQKIKNVDSEIGILRAKLQELTTKIKPIIINNKDKKINEQNKKVIEINKKVSEINKKVSEQNKAVKVNKINIKSNGNKNAGKK